MPLSCCYWGCRSARPHLAKQLAERGYRLLLVDRRQAQLEEVCATIADEYDTSAKPYAIDLCNRHEVEQLAQRLATSDVELLVNNAGFGTVDYFVDTDTSFLVGIAEIHVIAPTILTPHGAAGHGRAEPRQHHQRFVAGCLVS